MVEARRSVKIWLSIVVGELVRPRGRDRWGLVRHYPGVLDRCVPRVCLATVTAAVLSLCAAGCCGNPPSGEVPYSTDREGTISGVVLSDVRAANATADDRCEAACLLVEPDNDAAIEEISACEARGNASADPWDVASSVVTIACTTEYLGPAQCAGRRPQGHRPVPCVADSHAAWFAAAAHLESASVTAFVELASWLQRHDAPETFVDRCRQAARDEVGHARAMTQLALRGGVRPPAAVADPPSDGWLAVALHNAVEGCVHEAFSAIVARRQAETVRDPALAAVLGILASEELCHGQLAWDLHVWLSSRLSAADAATVDEAQRRALAALPETAACAARATPLGLGWPPAPEARALASAFARRIAASRAAPSDSLVG